MAEAENPSRQKVVAVMERKEQDAEILLCYDGSSDSERAIDAAAALYGARRACVLNVAPPMTFAEAMAATTSPVPGTAFEDLNMADALRRAEAGAARARDAGLEAVARATIGSTTWRGIVDVADELDVSVIVIGSSGLSGLREHARGSVSHDLATHARRPVLIVPPPARGAA